MTCAYVFGPIHLFGEDYLPVYKALMGLCKRYFDRVIGTYPDFWDSREGPKEFYTRTEKTITGCDLFVGEVSSPSHGVGMELQMARERNIPVIALAKQGIEVSKMVLGMPNIRKVIYYKDIDDLLGKLDDELKGFAKRSSHR